MFYQLYETIEESSVEKVIKRFSPRQRDVMLSNTLAEELIMYSVIGLESEELRLLFSRTALQNEFSRLPSTDLFYSFDLVQEVLPKEGIQQIFKDLSTVDFLEEYKKTPAVLFQMLDSGLLDLKDVVDKLSRLSLHEISKLRKYHKSFQRVWVGIEKLLQHCIFPVRTGVGFQGRTALESVKRAYSRDLAKMIVKYI